MHRLCLWVTSKSSISSSVDGPSLVQIPPLSIKPLTCNDYGGIRNSGNKQLLALVSVLGIEPGFSAAVSALNHVSHLSGPKSHILNSYFSYCC